MARSRALRHLTVAAGLLLYLQSPAGAATLIDFDSWPDGTVLSSQVSGVGFQNGIVLSAGISLNELEFPPHSGANVVSDNDGPLSLTFTPSTISISAYVSYATQLTLQVYSPTYALLGTAVSAFNSNMALSGDPGSSPNELILLYYPSGIGSVTITGDPLGGSFVLDDLIYTTGGQAIPEPGTSFLFIIGALGFALTRKYQCHTKT